MPVRDGDAVHLFFISVVCRIGAEMRPRAEKIYIAN
jgi:hypothetical protein